MILGRRPLRASALLWAVRSLFEHGRERWARLSPDEQRELRRLLTASRGRRRNLSEAEQLELRRIFRKSGGRSGESTPVRGAGEGEASEEQEMMRPIMEIARP